MSKRHHDKPHAAVRTEGLGAERILFGLFAAALIAVYAFWKIGAISMPVAGTAGDKSGTAQQQKVDWAGKPAPAFELPDGNGKMVKLADFRGKLVFLNVWATWCPPCKDEIPSMQKLNDKFNGKDFAMVTLSIDEQGKEVVEPFMKELGASFLVLYDKTQAVSNSYKITGVPETFIIGRDGIIIHHVVGPMDWSTPDMFGVFEELIKRTAS